ncbi:MAG: nucleotidyltransferase domain-containing protein [Armatimonadetes bacterium]|nr:nucleotidyltransferase domain-containing protein [Armatimonadota bacterium]
MTLTAVKDEVVQRFLDVYLPRIIEAYDPQHVILFGSRAAGTAHEDSDIDLLLVAERFREIRSVNRMGHMLITLRPKPALDVLCYTPEEFEQLRDGFGLVADICREGLWLM